MRLLILSISHAPEVTGTGKYTGEMAAWLAARGHAVKVIAAPPYYPAWRIFDGYSGLRYRREVRDGVEVRRCPLYVPSHPTGPRRLLHLASFALSSAPAALWEGWRWRPDVVISVEPTLGSAPAALLAARLAGAASWLHVQDLEIEAAFGLGLLSAGRAASWALGLDRRLTLGFDRVSTISRGMDRRLREKGVSPERLVSFPNWADTGRLRPDPSAGAAFRRGLGVSDETFLVLHAGNMGRKQGLEAMVEAARLSLDPKILFLLVGDGMERAALEAQAKGFSNVRFHPPVADGEMPGLLAAADLHLVVQKRGGADLAMPSKLAWSLAVGGRVVVTADPDTDLGRLSSEHPGIYELSPPEDPAALARAVKEAASRPRGPHAPARAYAESFFSKEPILKAFEKELLALAAGRK